MVPIAEVGRRLRAHRPGRDARDARLLGRAPAQLAVPRDRGDVLVRGAGARRGARDPGGGRRRWAPASRRSSRSRSAVALFHADARGARLRRHALAAARRAAALARVRRRDGRALRCRRTTRASTPAASSTRPTSTSPGSASPASSPLMAGSSLTLVTSVADFCRYTPTRRDVRIGLVASALTAAARRHVHRRLRGGRDRRDEPVRRASPT